MVILYVTAFLECNFEVIWTPFLNQRYYYYYYVRGRMNTVGKTRTVSMVLLVRYYCSLLHTSIVLLLS